MDLEDFIKASLEEDTGSGDHSSMAAIPADAQGTATLLVKEAGTIAGLELAGRIFRYRDKDLAVDFRNQDGDKVAPGDRAFTVRGSVRSILHTERLVLNCMQRMSGIATTTAKYVAAVRGTQARILDTRKTTPLFRKFEKEAVVTGGGHNHRMGLYDMIMLKDNHVDYSGGIESCITKTRAYLAAHGLDLPVEIEVRNLAELKQVLSVGFVDRVMLDNFDPSALLEAIRLVGGRVETEASGGITLDNIKAYAETGVDYISVGSLTHSYNSLDMSLKADR